MSDCKELAENVLMGIYEKHFGAKKEIEYLKLAIEMEKMRPTDKDGAKLKELMVKLGEAEKAYRATFMPMFKAKKLLRDIVHEWPEYVAASQTCKKAREGYEMASEACAEKEESYRRKYSEFKQREKSHMQSHQGGGDGFSMPMWTLTEPRKIAELKADCDALARKVRVAEEAFTAYKESIKYHYIARGMLEAMNDFE
jgi:DNA repair exonuclease SbcCD ATPase subunit